MKSNTLFKILLTDSSTGEQHWIDLTNHTKNSFWNEINKLFDYKTIQDSKLEIEEVVNVPFEFRHAGVGKNVLTDRFWDWKTYTESDRELLVKYMYEVSMDDESTLEEAKKYFNIIASS